MQGLLSNPIALMVGVESLGSIMPLVARYMSQPLGIGFCGRVGNILGRQGSISSGQDGMTRLQDAGSLTTR